MKFRDKSIVLKSGLGIEIAFCRIQCFSVVVLTDI